MLTVCHISRYLLLFSCSLSDKLKEEGRGKEKRPSNFIVLSKIGVRALPYSHHTNTPEHVPPIGYCHPLVPPIGYYHSLVPPIGYYHSSVPPIG
ncbi:hypothetical protein RRG08_062216 [Elysia crispata]|uniref:Uncharacterized protein n=1 Tax=Elysia crispata TaxID=231223 RepID=A0AAE0Y9K0_9GAST|nr:hypothetical protein RRG08_062216 [Elysia crispata]